MILHCIAIITLHAMWVVSPSSGYLTADEGEEEENMLHNISNRTMNFTNQQNNYLIQRITFKP